MTGVCRFKGGEGSYEGPPAFYQHGQNGIRDFPWQVSPWCMITAAKNSRFAAGEMTTVYLLKGIPKLIHYFFKSLASTLFEIFPGPVYSF